jgi:hypothetical protein
MKNYNSTTHRHSSDNLDGASACSCFRLWVLQPAAENQTELQPENGQRMAREWPENGQRMAREWPENGQRYRESLLSSPQVPEPAQRHREAMTRHAAHGAPFPFLLWHSRCQDTSADGCAHCTAMDGNTRCTQLQHQPSEGQIYM